MGWAIDDKKKQAAYSRRYYAENKEIILKKNQEWREKNKERHLSQTREYYAANREKINTERREKRKHNPKLFNDRARKNRFGISSEAYEAMLIAQDHCCDLCGERRQLVVDHNHQTGRVRALLCAPCNTALGLLKEDTTRIWRAMEYVVAHREAGA